MLACSALHTCTDNIETGTCAVWHVAAHALAAVAWARMTRAGTFRDVITATLQHNCP